MTSNILALIPARGGSKGIPHKNIMPIAGKPLIAYSILQGMASRHINRVIVTTDDPEIADISRQWGAEVPFMVLPSMPRIYPRTSTPSVMLSNGWRNTKTTRRMWLSICAHRGRCAVSNSLTRPSNCSYRIQRRTRCARSSWRCKHPTKCGRSVRTAN